MNVSDLRRGFARPDPRFGPVPFWWWSAEEVTEERVRWQMAKFRDGGLRNIGIINLSPTGPQYGSVSDRPAYGSEEWWQLFGVAVREAERLGMFVWFYDQIGFSGANLPARIVTERPEAAGYRLRRLQPQEELPESAQVLLESGGEVYAAVRQGFNWLDPAAAGELIDRVHGEMERRFPHHLGTTIAGSFQDELPPLPLWTPELPKLYKERFQEDLLPLLPALFDPLPGHERVRRRVYRLAAELAERAFFIPLGRWHRERGLLLCCDQAGPARKADPHGAQRLYLDYFRTHRWYNAAGSDMDGEIKPHSSMAHLHGGSGSRVFLEAFHSSGWGGTLEETMHWLLPWIQAGATVYSPHAVYYSTRGGWWEWAPPDTGWRQPYFEHYPVFADTVSRVCSLLSEGVHVCGVAVHYPSYAICGHLSLADGKPNEHPMSVANKELNERASHIQRVYRRITGSWSRQYHREPGVLRQAHIDFDIADDSALHKAIPEGRTLRIADERFSVLILCGTLEMDDEARARVEAWLAHGGTVVAAGVPAEERTWSGVIYVDTPEEAASVAADRAPATVSGPGASLHRRTPDADIFLLLPPDGSLLWMHEPATPDTALPQDAVYRLKTEGVPELWDPLSGETQPLPYRREGEWIELRVPFASWPAALVVCPAGTAASQASEQAPAAAMEGAPTASPQPARAGDAAAGPFPARIAAHAAASWRTALKLPADGWRIAAVPTLDNRYGDFDLHGEASGMLPIDRRIVRMQLETSGGKSASRATGAANGTLRTAGAMSTEGESAGWHEPALDDSGWASRLWSEAAYWDVCRGESFDEERAECKVYSNVFGDLSMRSWAGRMGRVPRRFLNLGEVPKGEAAWARTFVIAPEDGMYWIRTESNADISGTVNGQDIAWTGGPEERTAWIALRQGANELRLKAQAIGKGLMRAAVEVNRQARAPLPKWLFVREPHPGASLAKRVACPPDRPFRRVRIVFAARGRAALYVNGVKVTEHGDFNPYIRQGQEEVDVSPFWRCGDNEVRFALPEGRGEVFADGVVELQDGETLSFFTEVDWRDDRGEAPGIHHFSVLPFAETESLWISPRPHPLPGVGWLMPDSVPDPPPLPFAADPNALGRPVWLRFPLPVGARKLRIECAGSMRVWIGGKETPHRGGVVECPPQPPGTVAAIRIEPGGPLAEAAVLLAPIRIETAPATGALGDWRTALHLPHHSGAVEYETVVDTPPLAAAALDLGHVRGTAEVWLDGRPLGVRLWRPYRFSLGPLPKGSHRLRIRVTNTLGAFYEIGRPTSLVGGNADIAYWSRERKELEADWGKWFPSGGLYGPVSILEEQQ